MRNLRPFLVLIVFFLFSATIFSRLVFLQILNRQFWTALGEGQQNDVSPITGRRGEIFFQQGEPLAINKAAKYVFICPKEIKNKEETAQILSEALNIKQDELFEKVSETRLFEPVKHKLSEEEQQKIKEANIPGVYLEDEVVRYYPQKNLASHVVGFLAGDNTGQYGVEGFYNDILSGKEILASNEKGPFGYLLFSDSYKASKGADIFLTIDSSIQFKAEELLSKWQEKLGFEAGEILVLEPNSGEVLALAVAPSFDPNFYWQTEDLRVFQNPFAQKLFEPGSVLKPVVMAAGLNEGKITPQTKYIDKGILHIGGWPIENYGKYVWGEQTMTGVLEKSINTGAVFAEQQIGHKTFLKYLEKFGLFEETGIDLQGEVFSENLEFKKGYEINYATASYGQGIEITPIQLVRVFATIANQGKMPKLHLVSKIIENGQEKQLNFANQEQIISPEAASQITAMLISVVENGFAKSAKVPGYWIAGKTGTAQISWPVLDIQRAGYSDKTWQTFVGFAPALSPQFLIMVRLTDPKTKTAEYSAVPIFQELAQYIIDYWGIVPNYE